METLLTSSPFAVLSRREREVLELILQGVQVKDISEKLLLKPNTISTVKRNILTKMGTNNNIELFKLAQEHKIV